MQHIPARGRKHLVIAAIIQRASMQHIPTRGRKRVLLKQLFHSCGCSISPRGDGNCSCSSMYSARLDATYPRKGAETSNRYIYAQYCKMQHIPVRGRKRISSFLFPLFLSMRHIPARGRKRSSWTYFINSFQMQHIPARGWKLVIVEFIF